MPLDPAAIRQALVGVLDQLDGIVAVGDYEPLVAPTNNIPYASVRLGPIRPSPIRPFGHMSFDLSWRVNVILGANAVNAELDAQKLYESLVADVTALFEQNAMLETGGVALVDSCTFDGADMPARPSTDGNWVCQITLTTTVVTT